MYGGSVHHDALMDEQPGTFFLTDFLLRGFDGLVWAGLGLDRHLELRDDYFRNYTRLVYLSQSDGDALRDKARAVAARLALPLEIRHTGYGALESRLVELMRDIDNPRHQPTPPTPDQARRDNGNNNNVSDPVLARHPISGARARRPRTRQRRA
jgi:hypothetical protein